MPHGSQSLRHFFHDQGTMLIQSYRVILRNFSGLKSVPSFISSPKCPRRFDVVVLNLSEPSQISVVRRRSSTSFLTYLRNIGSSSRSVDKDSLKKKVDLSYPEQKIKVYACEDLYDRWRKEKKFRQIPRSGVFTEISYVDTMMNKECKRKSMDNAPTVLCIHGIPGNYGVFSHLITDLGNEGVRTIVPTFPDTLDLPGKYGTELFRHSVEEKTEVFKSFLKALKVSELDAIVAHSSAIYPALHLALDPELKVKCQVLFNTGGHRKTATMSPYWVIWLWAHMYLRPLGRNFALVSGKFMMNYVLRTPIKNDDMHGILLLAITMVYSECRKAKEQFQVVGKKQIPTLLCFSENDKVVERELIHEVISLLGASKENISYYDAEGNLKIKGNQKSWLKLLSFQAGSHYVFRKHPEICNKQVLALLQSVRSIHDSKC